MPQTRTRQRIFPVPSTMLFYYCMTALGHMRAQITAQDAGRGMIVATIGKGLFAPSGQLALTITALDGERAELSAAYRAQAWGGDRRILAAFVELLDSLVAQR